VTRSRKSKIKLKVNYPAAAAGPEGLWPGGSCGALKFKTYFHVVIPAKAGIQFILVPCFHGDKSGFPLSWE